MQLFPPPQIGEINLIEGATGALVATRVGTPHLMGFLVDDGHRFSPLHVGMTGIVVRGQRDDNGEPITLGNLECKNPGDPAVFLQHFP